MRRIPVVLPVQLLAVSALVAVSLIHVRFLQGRAAAPVTARDQGGIIEIIDVTAPDAAGGLKPGDRLLGWNAEALRTADAIEFNANFLSAGDRVHVTYVRDNVVCSADIRLVPAYPPGYWLVVTLIGLASVALGVFVLLARPLNAPAILLHWALVWMGIVVMIAYEGTPPGSPLGVVNSVLFFLSYMGVGICFCLFSLLFPRPIASMTAGQMLLVALPGLLVTSGVTLQYVRAVTARSITLFAGYNELYNVFHASVLLYAAAGIVAIIHSYRRVGTSEDRRKLQWVAWGFTVGPTPFLLLTVIPELFQPSGIVPEMYTLPFLVLIPLSLVVSFVRHRLLDISLVIRRTTAYALVLAVLGALYLGVVAGVAAVVNELTASAGAAVIVALLFEPVRVRVQRWVDRRFFRVQYNLQQTQSRMVEEIKGSMDEVSLARLLVDGIAALIPVERVGMFVRGEHEASLALMAGLGYGFEPQPAFSAELTHSLEKGVPVAREGALEPEAACVRGDAAQLDSLRLALIVPILHGQGCLAGVLVLGRKKAGTRFTIEDLELLSMLAVQAGLALQRFALQHRLFAEQAEKERLSELNQMKSDFVSYVSHELRTPLTSIKMFAELIGSPARGLDPKGHEYLGIIQGETDRLARMVSAILDSARIEHGDKVYTLKPIDLREAADAAMDAMRFQLQMQHFIVRYIRPRAELCVRGDPDALTDALLNILGNAVKYSAGTKWLRMSLTGLNGEALCSVEDRGIGISPGAIPHLFEKFFRDPLNSSRVQGIGLGLPLVKHIVDAHGGTIAVSSTPGRGSVFTLRLPLIPAGLPVQSPRKTAHEHHPDR